MKQIRVQSFQVFYCSQSTMKIVFKLFWRSTNFENYKSFPKQAIQGMNFKKTLCYFRPIRSMETLNFHKQPIQKVKFRNNASYSLEESVCEKIRFFKQATQVI